MYEQGFTKFEMAMGLALVAIVALVLLPPLHGKVDEDRSVRAWSRAESIAYAILDYHDETGRWPASRHGILDLSCLTEGAPTRSPVGAQADATMGASGLGTLASNEEIAGEPWIDEVPLDAWDRPYTVRILEIPNGGGEHAIIVLSAGPDGVLETDPEAWPLACLTGHEARRALDPDETVALDAPQEKLTVGDDLACMMTLPADGGTP